MADDAENLIHHWRTFLSHLIGGSPPPHTVSIRKLAQPMDELLRTTLPDETVKKYGRIRSAERQIEWAEARRAEQEIRRQLGPEAQISLSHTAGRVFAIGVARGSSRAAGIGIDAESSARVITSAVYARFASSAEIALGLKPVQVWVIKEACYKANPRNAGTAVSKYRIESYDPGNETGETSSPDGGRIHFSCSKMGQFYVALATTLYRD